MPKISLVINLDTRPENSSENGLSKGVIDRDFLDYGIENKRLFLKGFDFETIAYIDQHEENNESINSYVYEQCDTVVIRKHTQEHSFNDYNYLRALYMASGDIVIHVDQDTAMFTSGKEYVEELIDHLYDYKFVSYPSHWSPRPVIDESFGKRTWASTRFFICKRKTLNFDVLRNCIEEPEWAYKQFGDSPRRCNWLEHFLSLANNDSVYYPQINLDKGAIFSWGSYEKYTLRRLNELPYNEVVDFINQHGGIQYPNDIKM